MLSSSTEQLTNMFIRPQRHKYKQSDLGPCQFELLGRHVYREDFQLLNHNKLILKCSIYSLSKLLNLISKVVLYLHCNSGCRLEGVSYLKHCIAEEYALVVFDFAGSGNSDGEFVSLGYHEANDVDCVVKHLRRINNAMNICIWGRSMGAVAALRYIQTDSSIRIGIYDSPFASLRQLAGQIGKVQTNLPKIIVQLFLEYLKPLIKQKAGFDINAVDSKTNIEKIKAPGIFLGSKNDKLVPFSQVQELFELYKQRKELFLIQEDHNENRKQQTLDKIFKSLNKHMKQPMSLPLEIKELGSKKKLEITSKSRSHKHILMLRAYTTNSNTKQQDSQDHVDHKIGPKIPMSPMPYQFKPNKSKIKTHPLTLARKDYSKNVEPATLSLEKKQPLIKIKSSPRFKSKNIKNGITKENLLEEVEFRKIVKNAHINTVKQFSKSIHEFENSHTTQNRSRRTLHHILKTIDENDEKPHLKRISFTKQK